MSERRRLRAAGAPIAADDVMPTHLRRFRVGDWAELVDAARIADWVDVSVAAYGLYRDARWCGQLDRGEYRNRWLVEARRWELFSWADLERHRPGEAHRLRRRALEWGP